MNSRDLFELLLRRLDDLSPVFIGEFADALPSRRRYPPVYAWVDRDGAVHIDTDRATLARICVIESIRAGRPVGFGDAAVAQAVDRFVSLADEVSAAIMRDMEGQLAALKSARQRAALRWGAAR